jgi:hypothetical protein
MPQEAPMHAILLLPHLNNFSIVVCLPECLRYNILRLNRSKSLFKTRPKSLSHLDGLTVVRFWPLKARNACGSTRPEMSYLNISSLPTHQWSYSKQDAQY